MPRTDEPQPILRPLPILVAGALGLLVGLAWWLRADPVTPSAPDSQAATAPASSATRVGTSTLSHGGPAGLPAAPAAGHGNQMAQDQEDRR